MRDSRQIVPHELCSRAQLPLYPRGRGQWESRAPPRGSFILYSEIKAVPPTLPRSRAACCLSGKCPGGRRCRIDLSDDHWAKGGIVFFFAVMIAIWLAAVWFFFLVPEPPALF
jgi:hypothetical protein